ncbi:ASTRA complex subunit [Irineochytrium annulatum]|nr:ASTRA complex subunit [Irineochytrium annulatum]
MDRDFLLALGRGTAAAKSASNPTKSIGLASISQSSSTFSPSTTLEPLYILRTHTTDVTAVAFLLRHQCLATGDAAGTVIIHSLSTRRPLVTINAHAEGVMCIQSLCTFPDATAAEDAWAPGGRELLLTQGRDNDLHVWDLAALLDGREGKMHTIPVNSLNFCSFDLAQSRPRPGVSEEGQGGGVMMATVNALEVESYDLLDLSRRNFLRRAAGKMDGVKDGIVMCVRFYRDAKAGALRLAVGYESGIIRVWDVEGGKCVGEVKVLGQPVLCMDVDSDGKRMVAGGAEEKVVGFGTRFDEELSPLSVLSSPLPTSKGISAIRVRHDGKLAALGCWDFTLRLVSPKTLKPLAVLRLHRAGITSIDMGDGSIGGLEEPGSTVGEKEQGKVLGRTQDAMPGGLIAAASRDGRVSVWRPYP